jgi:mycothiol synthase
MSPRAALTTSTDLDDREVADVLALVDRATAADGANPLNEAALLHVRHPRADIQHLQARVGDQLVGYAQLEPGPETSVGQLVVDPDHRRRGVGAQLVGELVAAATNPLQIWAVGNSPAAQALAARTGLVIGRQLNIMKRSLTTPWPTPPTPAGVQIRAFRPGQDDQAWLAVNARAFSHHPEQGQITQADLDERMAEPWFDSAGFLVAIRSGALVGYHWTKQHEDHLGEVYVLGVDPDSGGGGLGKALLAAGLTFLRDRGNTEVELYVEADHERAVGLYEAYGFATASRDVMYVHPSLTRSNPLARRT